MDIATASAVLVRLEVPASGSDATEPFAALLRTDAAGRTSLTGASGSFLPPLEIGQQLLLVHEAQAESAYAPVVEVVAVSTDGHDSVDIRSLSEEARRSGRGGDRTVLDLAAGLLTGDVLRPGRVLDVSPGGARITHEGAALDAGAATELRCVVASPGGEDRTLHLRATVAWSTDADAGAMTGLAFADGQRLALGRLLLAVRTGIA